MQIFAVKDNKGNIRTCSTNSKAHANQNFLKMGVECTPGEVAVEWWKD